MTNGVEESEVWVRSIMREIRKAWEEEPEAFRAFYHKCRNRCHPISRGHLRYLVEKKFCLPNHQPDPRIKNIMCCAVSEDGNGFHIQSPFKK